MHPRRAARAVVAALLVGGSVVGCTRGEAEPGGRLRIGVKYDQPGLSLKEGDRMTGLDIAVARAVAASLGKTPEFVEAPSAQRQVLLTSGQLDLVVGTYSITPGREAKVGFAGPYFVAGQDLLVRREETSIRGPEDLVGRRVCSVSGSTASQTIKDRYPGVLLREAGRISDCVKPLTSGLVDAVTSDDVVLAGLAAEPELKGTLRLVGHPFTTEKYGVGMAKGNRRLCAQVTSALREMISSGAWAAAVHADLAPEGYVLRHGNPPQPVECTS